MPLNPDDIVSLTQPFVLDAGWTRALLDGYQEVTPLTDLEWAALPLVLRSQWLQFRLRGSRKRPEDEKVRFVLQRFFEVIDWLDHAAQQFLEGVRA